VVACLLAVLVSCKNQHMNKEKIIKSYFAGWEKKDWNLISSLLADGFTFTSPNGDDHISTEKFKEKCWVQADYIRKFTFTKIIGDGDEAFVTYECLTKNNSKFRNTEYFTFNKGKIKAIEVFFGTGQGFPSNEK
jgi:hypothetical protein